MNIATIFSITIWFVVQCWASEYETALDCGIMNPNGEYVKQRLPNNDTPRPEAIVGGDYARDGEIPFQVKLTIYSWYWPYSTIHCGGTLISNRCVLTAAHCFFWSPDYKMRSVVATFGLNDLNGDYSQSLTSYDFVVHEDYKHCGPQTGECGEHDIAIIRFAEDIDIGMTDNGKKSVGTVCLPFGNVSASAESGKISGWGQTEGGDNPMSNKLKVTASNKLNNCGTVETQICAVKTNGSSCAGDSGGPLFTVNDNKATQIGIISYGIGDCRLGGTDVFTLVKPYESWIRKQCRP